MTKTELIQVFAGCIGTIGFAILFHIRGKRFVAAAIGGLLSWLMVVLLNNVIESRPMIYFIVACAISLYAEVMARILKTPTTTFITPSLVPLIPGGSLYDSMVSAFHGSFDTFLPKAIYTMKLASALALGIILVTALVRAFNKISHNRSKKAKEQNDSQAC